MLLSCTAVNAVAKASLSNREAYTAASDTVDIDEEEFIANKDVSKLSKINRAQQEGQMNGHDYIMENRFLPSGDTFTSKSFWDHFYFMGGFGLQRIGGIEGYKFNTMENAHIGVGKNFTPLSSARFYINLENALRFQSGNTSRNYMVNGNIDYMYNLSTYFAGYNPQRPVNIGAFGGIGFGFTKTSNVDWDWLADEMKGLKFSVNAHFGLSIGIYGGPRSYLSIEPYVGVASDQIDNSIKRNWHKYDLYYGIRGTYAYYLRDHNSPEAWNRIRSSWHYAGLTDVEKLRVWQNPYFIDFQTGASFGHRGHNTAVAVGKWFSPAFGMRIGATGRNAEYAEVSQGDGYRMSNRYSWGGLRVEGIVNPFGFGRYYDWNSQYGAYLVGGLSIGRIEKFNGSNSIYTSKLVNVEAGIHGWYGVDRGVQVFIEPHVTRYEGVAKLAKRYAYDINVGFTVTSEARKYRDTYLPEELPIYPNVASRLTLGVGAAYLQRQQTHYPYLSAQKKSIVSGFTLFGEYRFNHYISTRIGMEYINLYDITGNQKPKWDGGYAINHSSHMSMFNIGPVFHLASLMRGVDPYRKWDVDGGIGLTASWLSGGTASVIVGNPEYPITESDLKLGGNINLRLSYRFTNQASVFFMPTAYLVKNVKYGSPTPKMGGWQALQTFNLGVQYALAPAKRLSAFEDSLDLERWRDPLFVEASSGICMTSAQNQDPNVGGSRLGIGYESSVSVGKWFAPVAGFRGTLTRRSTEWGYYEWGSNKGDHPLKSGTEFFNENFLGGRVDLLVNPMGFFKDFTWDDPWGVYGFVGIGMGQKRMHRYMTGAYIDKKPVDDSFGILKQNITSLNFGVHPWYKLSDDVNVFIEYLYTTASSTRPQDPVYESWGFNDNNQGRHSIKLGFGMNLRTEKYREMRDISAMYDFKPWLSSRLRFGIGGGFNMFHSYRGHTSKAVGSKGFINGGQGMIYGEYRFAEYFAGRLTYELVGRSDMQSARVVNLGLLSASFNANLTTLMGGFRPRTTEYDAYIGPTVYFQDASKVWHLDEGNHAKEISVGLHAGIRISRRLVDRLAAFCQPTIYVLNRAGQHHFLGKTTLLQTINFGVHYTLR